MTNETEVIDEVVNKAIMTNETEVIDEVVNRAIMTNKTNGKSKKGKKRKKSSAFASFFRSWSKCKTIYVSLMLFFLGVFVYSLISLIKIQLEYKEGVDTYNEIINEFVVTTTDKPPVVTGENVGDDTVQETQETTNSKKPEETEQKLEVNFDKLKNVNQDVVGWIFSPGTVINYPIVKGEDNEFYLNHLFNKKAVKMEVYLWIVLTM